MKKAISTPASQLVKLFQHSLLASGLMLTLAPQVWAACTYTVTNNWGSGFTGEIKVTNDTSQTVNGWSVSWLESGVRVNNSWNAALSGSNPYTASALGWNATLAPKASASFGFQANGKAGAPALSGSLCGAAASSTSSVQSSSKASVSSAQVSSSSVKSSVVSSSKSSSSVASSAATESSWLFEESAVGFCGNSGVIDTKHTGYTGTGFVDTENAIGAAILWSITAASAKTYTAQIRFGNGGAGARRATLVVNDAQIKTLDFPTNSNWAQWQTVNIDVPLKTGTNSIKLVAEIADGLANIDNIRLTGNGITPAACPTTTTPTTQDCNSITNQPILRVAADGSGQYKTIAAALNTISSSNTTATQIRIKPGTYREKLTITKPFITFCGETGKQASTILTYNDGASTLKADGTAIGTSGSASVTIKTNDISMDNITIENSFGVGSQAVALLAQGQRLQFRNCRLIGNQDTLYTHSGTQYYRNCHIQGTVDFIFGAATAVFDNNTIHSVGGGSALVAPSTEQPVPYGLVFLGGKVTAVSSVRKGSVALGRNWRPYGAAAYIRTELGQHISAVGWVKMSENTLDTARFSEYLTTGAGANTSARAPQSKQLSAAQAATYTISNIFGSWSPSYSK